MINQQTSSLPDKAADETAFNFLDLLIVLARYKKLIIGSTLIVSVAAAAVCFMLPNVYRAATRLLPPQQAQSGAAALLAQLGGAVGAVAGSSAGLKNPNDIYIGMLRSRTIADNLIKRFHLERVYDTDALDKTREKLESHTSIVSGKDGLIEIAFENEDKRLVAPLTNAYVDELIKLTKVLAVTEASQRRLFFEHQLEQAKNNLANAEAALKGGLDSHGVISVDGESRAIVETVGRLRAQISAKEIQLNSMRAFVTSGNQEFKRTQEELNSLRSELANLENGRPGRDSQSASIPSKSVGLENIKILRDVKYYQMLYELLAKQYELARLDEAKDSSIIQTLDPAIEPERKDKPHRAIIIIISAVLTLFIGIGVALLSEAKRYALLNPACAGQWDKLKANLHWK